MFSCDLHDGEMTKDVEPVSFGFDGASYELDACEQHRSEMQEAFATYVGAARKASGGGSGASARRTSRSSSRSSGGSSSSGGGSDREQVQAVREWARSNGHKVSERGRLSASVLEAYRAAH
ncbi:MAG: hypothetical protein AVDCRST_MAG07-3311 [uncultured Frankineae bacterium]|uniref:Histone protein Lsr2 n=1 Tax=uncultured Frankineae bacterium TaxID=437475 RepID=A0A6J4MBB2_9ACTN|nr:MAG: hypothetical protein AVDCRST_MAG07-3311 [uncultured Frankineae bacterium]